MINASIKSIWTPVILAAAALVSMTPAAFARPFHIWNITELYSNSNGTLQFIELHTTQPGQQFFQTSNAGPILSSNIGGTITRPPLILDHDLPGDSANHSFLIGTAGIVAAGGPTPDYIMQDGFLFTNGGHLDFFNSSFFGDYVALPTDGLRSLIWGTSTFNAINSPTNYAGVTSTVNGVPEPSTLILSSLGAIGSSIYLRRKRRTAAAGGSDPQAGSMS